MTQQAPFSYPKTFSGARRQSGAVLIVVLLVLILIMIVGTIAVRQSTTDLKVATADQVNKILFQANDAAFMKIEKEDRIRSTRRGSTDTLKGYMSESDREGHEVSFCIRPRSDRLFSILEISERDENNNPLAGTTNGYCDPENDDDYVSEGRVMTQMTFVRPVQANDAGILGQETEGTSSNDMEQQQNVSKSPIECTTFVGYVTSVVPALTQSPLDDIASCFEQPRTGGSTTVDTCLAALGVPFQTQQQSYLNQPLGVNCVSDD